MNEENEAITRSLEETTAQMKKDQEKQQRIIEGEKMQAFLDKNATVIMSVLRDKIRKGETQKDFVPTGFKNLDTVLDGGLYPGLYILGAVSSLGKTSLLLQLADQISAAGYGVAYISMEMAASELVSKSISRLTYENCHGVMSNAKTVRGILSAGRYSKYNAEEKQLIEDSMKKYEDLAQHLYIYEGVGNIGVDQVRQIAQEQIKRTKKKPVLLLDYLQILAPYDPRSSDKQNTDKAVLELKRISRDFDIPVLAISSFNRENYTTYITMNAFKESGAVEYGSDVLMALQPIGVKRGYRKDTLQQNAVTIEKCKHSKNRHLELIVLKNRNGSTNLKANFLYKTLFNCFRDQGTASDEPEYEDGQEPDQEQADFEPIVYEELTISDDDNPFL